jgi:phenylalanyl-tRNA synthetase beta chain
MRVPLSWLSEYVDITVEPEELARRLTIAGVEVAEVVRTGGDWRGIRVASVEKVEPHPNADRLSLATVSLGDSERHTVVCGAPNIRPGQKVAFATVGTRIIDGHTGRPATLKAARIRGVESAGMVLSEKELGISDQHEGILELPEDAPVGAPLERVIGDTIFVMDIRPNRPDLMSVLGVAREVAALTGQKVREPSIQYEAAGKPIKGRVSVEIADPDLCPRYVAAVVEGVRIAESPPWMQQRLTAAGLRPINNVVDITNYVMLELGQPQHAFDLEKIAGKKIIVRRARPGETLAMIDGSVKVLTPDMLVIADAERAAAVAGVMGGGDSEVTPETRTVLLECANFAAASIRRTSAALKLRTDASIRFEKGISPKLPEFATARALKLMAELTGGRVAQGVVDVYPRKAKDIRITVTQDRIRRVLGLEPDASQVRGILTSLGFGCRWMAPGHYIVRVPDWRTDVTIADDVIEEFARVIGYDNLPTRLLSGALPPHEPQPRRSVAERVRDALAAAGMQEVITYSMTDLRTLERVLAPEALAANPPLRLANPVSRQHEYARTTLRGSLLATLAANTRGHQRWTALFEVGRVYLPRDEDLPDEIETVCGVVTGRRPDRWGQPRGEPAGFYDAKGYVEHLLTALRVGASFEETVEYCYLPGRTAAVVVGGERVGFVGQVHPNVAAGFNIQADVAMFELNVDALVPHVTEVVHYQPISPYPTVEQDLAVIVPEATPAGRVLEIIESFPLVRSASIFDVYRGPPVPEGRKSLAFSVSFGSDKKTLEDRDVARERERIVARLRQELGAELR